MTARRTIVLAILAALNLYARRLPIQVFSTTQGLPRNSATCLVPDANGLLWVCTSEGLARFDGSEFRTFGQQQGLPSSSILNFLVSQKGGYWVVTDAGVCRLPRTSKVGDTCRALVAEKILGQYQTGSLVERGDGRIWVATGEALYLSSPDGLRLEKTAPPLAGDHIAALGAAPDGNLLVSTFKTVYLWDGQGYRDLGSSSSSKCGFGEIHAGAAGEVWVVGGCDVFRITGWGSKSGPRMDTVSFGRPLGAGHLIIARDHSLWVAARPGLQHWEQKPDGTLVEEGEFGTANGLPYPWITEIAEDGQGSLWGATDGLGIFRISSTRFRVYHPEDGVGSGRISSIFETLEGELCVTATSLAAHTSSSHLRVKNGDHFDQIDMRHGARFHSWGWGWNQIALQAHDGEWWFQTEQGLYRFPGTPRPQGLNGIGPSQIYDRDSALGEDEIFRVFEDSHGDLWVATVGPHNELIRWERSTGRFRHWTAADGYPVDGVTTTLRETKSGTLWLGSFDGLLRFRNGRFEHFGIPSTKLISVVRDLHIDRDGRIWIATGHDGLYRCDNPDDAVPVFRHYSMQQGLSSDSARSITEDNSGFIYVGTVRAIDRIDPRSPIESGNILHFTSADGLPDGEQNVAFRDRKGHLWFGTLQGLAEFDPAQPVVRTVPSVYIRRVRVRGEEVPLPWEGARHFALDLHSDQNQVEIEYAGVDLQSITPLRYQYRLSGVDAKWSQPSPQTSVNYANLPAGKRAFEVRAVADDGSVGAAVAAVSLDLDAPLWRRPWFALSFALLASAIVYWLYNYRVHHLLAMERMRTRIATDLHDDIGASLTQISLLSEVGRRDPSRNVLGEVAGIARDLVREMSDIVWAVSPRHDRVDAIVHRMRRFAEDAMADGELVFDASGLPSALHLPLEYRQPLYLVVKEAVNNVARHAVATRMTIRISARDAFLEVAIEDNGCGFDPRASFNGEGLPSIRRRVKELAGTVEWDSAPGKGTRFLAAFPLRPRRFLPKLGGTFARLARLR
jgi:signal transduction histidine kinase/ligand-binding sensor domain-containing protein